LCCLNRELPEPDCRIDVDRSRIRRAREVWERSAKLKYECCQRCEFRRLARVPVACKAVQVTNLLLRRAYAERCDVLSSDLYPD
jgi:hypothetical protein